MLGSIEWSADSAHSSLRWLGPSLMVASLLAFLVVTPAAGATTIRHVAITGADAGDCTVASEPCRTITYALTQTVAGDTITVAPGEYAEHVDVRTEGITIEGADPETTVVNGAAACADTTQRHTETIAVWQDGVTLRRLGISGNCPEGVVVVSGTTTFDSDAFSETTNMGVSMAGGSATVSDSLFLGRTGVCDRAKGRMVVLASTFRTSDFGICVNTSDATVHFNRITGGTTTGVSVNAQGLGGTADIDDNWWGCNGGPNAPGCATLVPGSTKVDSWLQLRPVDPPAAVAPGATAQLTFGLISSASGRVAAEFPTAPISFSATVGSLDPTKTPLAGGVATTMFTAPAEDGTYVVTAELDQGTASVALNGPAPTPPSPTPGYSPATTPAPSVTLPPTSTLAEEDGGGGRSPVGIPVFALVSFALALVWEPLPRRIAARRGPRAAM